MKYSALHHAMLALLLLGLSGCGHLTKGGKDTSYQAGEFANGSAKVQPYIRSVTIYDQLTTQAMFDALWLSDEVRVAYADLYVFRRGKEQEYKNAFLRQQLEENRHHISWYVLSLHEVALDDPQSLWSVFLCIDENTVTPVDVKAVELPYEYRIFFGSHLTAFKIPYLIRFDAKDSQGKPFITSRTRSIALHFRSAEKERVLLWEIDGHGRLVSTKKCSSSKIKDKINNQKQSPKRIKMKIAIGADHRGYEHKEYIKQHLKTEKESIEWLDVGAFDMERSDYPVFAKAVSKAILNGEAQLGILTCGSGVGMAVVANRYPKIYAALAWNEDVARVSREHDNTNVLVIPSDFVSTEQAVAMVKGWLEAEFLGGRYQKRLDMFDTI